MHHKHSLARIPRPLMPPASLLAQVRVWDALTSTGLPAEAVRAALLLRGNASAEQEGSVRLDLQSGGWGG